MVKLNTVYNEDCLVGMVDIPDKSIDMILCDLPYGITARKWDTVIPFEPLWEEYERVIKDDGAIVLTASQPFTSALVMSNPSIFKYEWVWDKRNVTNPMSAKYRPMGQHESILIFGKGKTKYNPQFEIIKKDDYRYSKSGRVTKSHKDTVYGDMKDLKLKESGKRYPKTILPIANSNSVKKIHPTQKPVALFEYLIKTYTNEGDTVLDNCIGSGTTAIAAINTGRNYIGYELDEEYHKLSEQRISDHVKLKDKSI